MIRCQTEETLPRKHTYESLVTIFIKTNFEVIG